MADIDYVQYDHMHSSSLLTCLFLQDLKYFPKQYLPILFNLYEQMLLTLLM